MRTQEVTPSNCHFIDPTDAVIGTSVLAWSLLAEGDAYRWGTFSGPSLLLVSCGVTVLAIAALRRARRARAVALALARPALVVAMVTEAVSPFLRTDLTHMTPIGAAATVLGVAVVLGVLLEGRLGAKLPIAVILCCLALVAGVATIIANPRPPIDVWYMLQATAQAVAQGHNPYLAHFSSGIPGEVSNHFVYLPMTPLVLAPFKVIFGDVRYGILAAQLVAGWTAVQLAGKTKGWLPAALIWFFPFSGFSLIQAWSDPILLAELGIVVLAVSRNRYRMATIALFVALATKQYAWLFLPLACFWPALSWRRVACAAVAAFTFVGAWAAIDPTPFWSGAVELNLQLPPRLDSLSLFSGFMHAGLEPGYELLGGLAIAGSAIALNARSSDSGDFLLGCAVIMACFDFGLKQAFFNEWQLAAGLVALTIGAHSGSDPVRQEPGDLRTTRLRRCYGPTGSPG